MESSLELAVARMRRETGVSVVFGGLVERGRDRFAITASSGASTGALDRLVITAGRGIGGQVLRGGRLASVADYTTAESITHHYDRSVAAERLRSVVGAPVFVNGEIRAVIYGAMRTPVELGSRFLDTFAAGASRFAFAIAVNEAAERRVRMLETAATLQHQRMLPPSAEREAMRTVYAELRELAATTADPGLRARLESMASTLSADQDPSPTARLSEREKDVLSLVSVGCGNPEIADRLGLTRETVKSYLRGAMHKLGAHSRAEAVSLARRGRLLP